MFKISGFPIMQIAVVGVIVFAVIAFAVPILHCIALSSQETGAAQTLKSLCSTEATWYNVDTDRNGIKDYWTADISGFYRVQDATGSPAQVIDISFARADWNPIPAGGGVPVVGALVTPINTPVAKSGYYYAAFVNDENGSPMTEDTDGKGQAYENARRFAFQAFSEKFPQSGNWALIVSETRSVFRIDAIDPEGAEGRNYGLAFNNPLTGEPATAAPILTLTDWPHSDPGLAGYHNIDGPYESEPLQWYIVALIFFAIGVSSAVFARRFLKS